MTNVEILLATYNGEKYIKSQLHSLLLLHKPDNVNLNILISDDGSSDNTVSIIKEFILNSNGLLNIELISCERAGGVHENFKRLIYKSNATYSFFCDQDDFWLPNRLQQFLDEFGYVDNSKPALIFSDLCIVDENLCPLQISMFDYQEINRTPSLNNLLVGNSVTGCAMALNKSAMILLKQATIEKSIMHDWYAGLIVAIFGEIRFLSKGTILYRQHMSNQLGAKKISLTNLLEFKGLFIKAKKAISSIKKTREQAILLINDFGSDIPCSKREVIESYIESFEKNIFNKILMVLKGFRKKGFARNLFFLAGYLTLTKSSFVNPD